MNGIVSWANQIAKPASEKVIDRAIPGGKNPSPKYDENKGSWFALDYDTDVVDQSGIAIVDHNESLVSCQRIVAKGH